MGSKDDEEEVMKAKLLNSTLMNGRFSVLFMSQITHCQKIIHVLPKNQVEDTLTLTGSSLSS